MPNVKSAAKRMKTDAVKAIANKSRRSKIATFEKRFLAALKEKNQKLAKEELSSYFSCLDKAVKLSVIKKNKASRKKSRLSSKINQLT